MEPRRAMRASWLVAGLAFGLASGPASAATDVVASIKPVHSLVAGVMEGVGRPYLLIRGGGSPHSYSLKPSEAQALADAQIVFWVGEGLEAFLEGPLDALAGKASVIALADAEGIELLESRAGGTWAAHGRKDDHEREETEHAHGHEEHAEHEGTDPAVEHAGHHHGDHDMHIWLDPNNAKSMVRAAVATLSEADPENAGRYEENGASVIARIEALDGEIAATLEPVKDQPYVVFHDAYQYLEEHYGLNAVGSITVSPDRAPGARRLYELREKIIDRGARCVFAEPQFEPALVQTVIEGTPAKSAVLDPLGAELAEGPDAYFEVMRGIAGSLRACLSPDS